MDRVFDQKVRLRKTEEAEPLVQIDLYLTAIEEVFGIG